MNSCFSTLFNTCNLAPIKTLFAFSTKISGSAQEYASLIMSNFTVHCSDYAKNHPKFAYEVQIINVQNQAQVEEILENIQKIDHLVLSSAINDKRNFESRMSDFMRNASQLNPKNLKSNAAFAVREDGQCDGGDVRSMLQNCVSGEFLNTFKVADVLPGECHVKKMKYLLPADEDKAKDAAKKIFDEFILKQ